jgi:hypothetical protein
MKKYISLLGTLLVSLSLMSQTTIYYLPQGPRKASLAAKELRRYIYQRTGEMSTISSLPKLPKDYKNLIVLMVKGQVMPKGFTIAPDVQQTINGLKPEEFCLRSFLFKDDPCLIICGGDSIGMLYGAYRFAEIIGARFYLHGDVIPETKIGFNISEINEIQKPMFALRGIQPYHDFAEGPDWWETDNYLAIVDQLPKMKMNFIGLHTYTNADKYVCYEPNVWIGQPDEYDANGKVKKSYPSKYNNTGLFSWGYKPRKTSDYSWGADQLFEKDFYTSGVMDGLTPIPDSPEKMNELFNRTADMLKVSFTKARSLGVKTCIGTELPLTIHYSITDEMKKNGKTLDSAYAANLYKGVFGRIEKAYPIDYYWLWTDEGWTWSIPEPEKQKAVLSDLQTAIAVHKEMKPSFKLATCGWVLGPPQDRSLFDKILPKEMPMSCINRYVGYSPVEIGFASVNGRDKWAIPWMEDDPRMISPQLWVGRVRRDAADAYAYGCNGLMGIHWRTDIISPNIAALAQAGWSHKGWNKKPGERYTPAPRVYANVDGTDEDQVYGKAVYNAGVYWLYVNEPIDITLKFCEVSYDKEGQRLFDILINDSIVKADVDVYKLAGGKNRPCDLLFKNIKGNPNQVRISFKRKSGPGYPMISGIVAEGKTYKKKINCGGDTYKDYEKDLINSWDPRHPLYGNVIHEQPEIDYIKEIMDYKPTSDFYVDWCLSMFGPEISTEASRIFTALDGNFPLASEWRTGPGNIRLIKNAWVDEDKKYSFIAGFEGLTRLVKGPGNIERYNYWLNKFKYQRALAHLGCVLTDYYALMKNIEQTDDNFKKKDMILKNAMPMRIEMNTLWGEAQTCLLESINTTGDMGVIANLENHSMAEGTITKYDSLIKAVIWQDLPKTAQPSKEYKGKLRIFAPSVRTSINKKEDFSLKIIILGSFDESGLFFWWKKMGANESYQKLPLKHVNHGVYTIAIPASSIAGNDFEYYVSVIGKGGNVVFPASAPQLNNTVIVVE